jgi:hypothetical protein
MTFQEAKEKLKGIANGRYHSLSYELTEYAGGGQQPECLVYIDQYKHHKGLTWEEAFLSLDRQINGLVVDEKESPDFVVSQETIVDEQRGAS